MVPPASLPAALGPALEWLDLAGIFVFAASGALLAASRRQTLVTFIFFAVITGVGGGTVRDLLIGAPVFWIAENTVLLICIAAALTVGLILAGIAGAVAGLVAFAAGFALRGAAISRGWSLPTYGR